MLLYIVKLTDGRKIEIWANSPAHAIFILKSINPNLGYLEINPIPESEGMGFFYPFC